MERTRYNESDEVLKRQHTEEYLKVFVKNIEEVQDCFGYSRSQYGAAKQAAQQQGNWCDVQEEIFKCLQKLHEYTDEATCFPILQEAVELVFELNADRFLAKHADDAQNAFAALEKSMSELLKGTRGIREN